MGAQRKYSYAEQENNRRLRNQAYVTGTAARKLAPAPERDPRIERRWQEEREYQNREESILGFRRNIDFLTVAMLGIALVVICALAIQYLSVSANITEVDKAINSLEDELFALSQENDSRLANIAADVDLNEVYEVAVGEMGMVFPNHNQIIEFSYADTGYVRQYSAIPETEAEQVSAVQEILNRILR